MPIKTKGVRFAAGCGGGCDRRRGGHVAARSGVVADPLRGLRRVCRYDVTDVVYYSQVRGL